MATVRERIYEVFRKRKLTKIFGNPGSTELPFLQDFPEDFSYVVGLHEGTAVGMAMGYSLVSDSPSVVNLHTTAGTGNAMGAIVTAWHGQIPLIITAGQQDRRQIRTEPFLWGRQVDFVKPYVKWSIEPERPLDVPEAIERAYHFACADPKGPVFVSIPMDGMEDECPPVEMRNVSYATVPDPAAISQAAKILSQAKKIALIAGEQVDSSGATEDLVKLAEKLRSRVFLSPLSSRWGFPSAHPLFSGRLPPAMKPLSDALSPFDAVLVAGSPVFAYYPYVPGPVIKEGTTVIQLTNDPSEASRAVTGMSIVGNVSFSIKQLLDQIGERTTEEPFRKPPGQESPAKPSKPPNAEYVHQELAGAIPENAIIFDEDPSTQKYFRVRIVHPKSYFETASGGLGFAMPASVGAALATSRPVVCIVGDGSAQYSIQSLWSAANYGAKVTFIVLNNSEYAILKAFGMLLGEKGLPGLDIPGIDFEHLARGYGVDFQRVAEPEQISSTVRSSFGSKGSTLIEIPIDPTVPSLL